MMVEPIRDEMFEKQGGSDVDGWNQACHCSNQEEGGERDSTT